PLQEQLARRRGKPQQNLAEADDARLTCVSISQHWESARARSSTDSRNSRRRPDMAFNHITMVRMKRRKAIELEQLRRRIARLDSSSIDQLYGLEPVYEPASGHGRPEEFVAVQCPYCGERLE